LTDAYRLGRDGSRLTVLYDRDCGICGLAARSIRRWDRRGRFEIVPLQVASSGGDASLVEVAATYALTDELHVLDADLRVAAGGDAVLAIIDALPGGRVLRPWSALAPFRSVVRVAYAAIARHRRTIGRWLGLELVCATATAPGATIGR
jgi:predicted DCC family thiol-disulfide oxidoreductase YuxK